MKGAIKFKDGHSEDILKHVGFETAGVFVTGYGTYIRTDDTKFYRYIRDFDMYVPCVDIASIEMEEE